MFNKLVRSKHCNSVPIHLWYAEQDTGYSGSRIYLSGKWCTSSCILITKYRNSCEKLIYLPNFCVCFTCVGFNNSLQVLWDWLSTSDHLSNVVLIMLCTHLCVHNCYDFSWLIMSILSGSIICNVVHAKIKLKILLVKENIFSTHLLPHVILIWHK